MLADGDDVASTEESTVDSKLQRCADRLLEFEDGSRHEAEDPMEWESRAGEFDGRLDEDVVQDGSRNRLAGQRSVDLDGRGGGLDEAAPVARRVCHRKDRPAPAGPGTELAR